MRARLIKPGFFQSERLAAVSLAARLLFAGLWCMADREGKLEDRPAKIRANIFPYDNNIDCNVLLDELYVAGRIVRYSANGMALIKIPAFTKHQSPHIKEAPSDLPDPTPETLRPVTSSLHHTNIGRASDKSRKGSKALDLDLYSISTSTKITEKKSTLRDPGSTLVTKLEFPANIDGEGCRHALARWLDYKAERKEHYKSTLSLNTMLRRWAGMGPTRFCAAIDYSIEHGWSGIYEERSNNGKSATNFKSNLDRNAEIRRRALLTSDNEDDNT